MINEILQWIAILIVAFLVIAPIVNDVVQDFKKAEEEE